MALKADKNFLKNLADSFGRAFAFYFYFYFTTSRETVSRGEALTT